MPRPNSRRLFLGLIIAGALFFSACPPPEADPGQEDEPSPDEPKFSLAKTSWEWNGVKLVFEETKVKLNTTPYSYTYEDETRTGKADTLGDFSLDEGYLNLTFPNFKGNIGAAVFQNTAAAIIGTTWVWGQSLLTFTPGTAKINSLEYPYEFDPGTKQGNIEKIGGFTLTEETLEIARWRKSRFTVAFVKGSAPPPWNGNLIGTSWGWHNPFNGFMIFDFMTDTEVILTFTNSVYYDDTPFENPYTYSETEKKGNIPTQGAFSISASNRTMSFPKWQNYGHGADYTRN